MDLDALITTIKEHRPLEEQKIETLFRMAKDILYQEGTLISITTPITVCGDVHGQIYDVVRIFDADVGGDPSSTKYLFLGDYVDRGSFSIETFSLLLAYKVRYPDRFFLLRGNHECRQVNATYGFYNEVVQRFGHSGLYILSNDLLPMAAIIDNKIFCIHGGLSPNIKIVEQVALYDRRQEIPSSGPISDLCWSDPDDAITGWGLNQRGAGFTFGSEATQQFCQQNDLNLVVRAHQLAMNGYTWHFDNHLCVTVWSAPNYMYRSGNIASVMKVDSDLQPRFITFDAVPDDQRVIPSEEMPPYFA